MSDLSPPTHWLDRAPAMLRDTLTGPRGEPCFTTTDRRWLWRLEGFLAVNGTNPAHHEMQRDLRQYLDETCEHHWQDYKAEGDIAAHRQCTWCSDVEWAEPNP
jgi:hypothetical protein